MDAVSGVCKRDGQGRARAATGNSAMDKSNERAAAWDGWSGGRRRCSQPRPRPSSVALPGHWVGPEVVGAAKCGKRLTVHYFILLSLGWSGRPHLPEHGAIVRGIPLRTIFLSSRICIAQPCRRQSQECGMRGRPTRPKHLDQTPVTRVDLRGVGRWRSRRRRRSNRLWQSYGVQVETQLAEYKDGCSPETTFPLLRFLVAPFLWTNVTPLEYSGHCTPPADRGPW